MMRITYDNGNMIDYLYSASGVKLEVTHTTNKLLMVNSNIGNRASAKVLQQTTDLLTIDEPALAGRTRIQATAASNLEVQTTDYINGYILENGTLSQIQLNGGYMTEDSQGKAVYHFYLQDHQGNNRVVVNGKTLAVEQVNHYYPYGGLFAESTGGEMQAFKYNGKELDRVCGLNWYDHGARHNDAAIGRWHCIDPLAEKYYSISPYAYCAGDPVNYVDRDGRAIIFVNGYRPLHGHHDMSTSRTRRCNNQGVYKRDVKDYWKGIDKNYKDLYKDDNAVYTSGSAGMSSQADERYDEGIVKAGLFHEKVQSGDIKLDKDENGNPIEPIRLVAHSMGGATAAGMAERLTELGYNVEVIVYIHPHQAKDIKHPKGISGKQYDKKHDRVVSNFGKGRKKRGKIDGIEDENYHVDNSDFWDLKGGHGVAKHRKNIGK